MCIDPPVGLQAAFNIFHLITGSDPSSGDAPLPSSPCDLCRQALTGSASFEN